ncbi:ATPase domain-containing protein [Melittangium boletus]|uniref:ATPase domain-containing protein n=1 Tax=Melittangium boletus TaxID=83453 RepID=UPI003DA5D5CF
MTAGGPGPRQRISTGIPGLDTVLHGGFLRGRTYMVMGLPGAGKTILANQTCFHHIRQGERVLYVTLLAESHAELVSNMHTLSFFDTSRIPDTVTYVSAFNALEDGGLEALLELIRKEIRLRGASLLVLDGLVAAEEVASSPQALKRFIHSLQVVTHLLECTTLILTTGAGKGLRAEHTMVDGLIVLQQRTQGVRTRRELYVRKFRGGPHLLGRHGFEITADGLVVYPRLESMVADIGGEEPPPSLRRPFGVPGLDTMLQGGVASGSTTLLFGPPGGGKTLLGVNFLAEGARRGELSHYFAFYDSPTRMIEQARGIGVDLLSLMKQGTFEVSFRPPTENLLDKLGTQLLTLVRERRVRRLFVDGYDALQKASTQRGRVVRFLAALVSECRQRDVTLLFSAETPSAFGPQLHFPLQGLSMVAENTLYLRTVELNAQLRRFVCVLKMRTSDYDPSFRELLIGSTGLEVGPVLEEGQQLLTGVARFPFLPRGQ